VQVEHGQVLRRHGAAQQAHGSHSRARGTRRALAHAQGQRPTAPPARTCGGARRAPAIVRAQPRAKHPCPPHHDAAALARQVRHERDPPRMAPTVREGAGRTATRGARARRVPAPPTHSARLRAGGASPTPRSAAAAALSFYRASRYATTNVSHLQACASRGQPILEARLARPVHSSRHESRVHVKPLHGERSGSVSYRFSCAPHYDTRLRSMRDHTCMGSAAALVRCATHSREMKPRGSR
jgi:hypothetical protein